MGWHTTPDLDKFLAAASGYLTACAAENITLLQAAQEAVGRGHEHAGDSLYGWWAPSGGAMPQGAFLHGPSGPLLIAGRAPEIAAALAAPLARAQQRAVSGVDAGVVAADAFAAAWRQRAGVAARMHRSSHVYRLAGALSEYQGPPGRARSATWADRELLVGWLRAFGHETGVLADMPEASADDMLGYGGAVLWEADGRPVAMAIMTRVVAGVVQVTNVYSPPEFRGRGYGVAVMVAVSRAALVGRAREVVMIADRVRPLRSPVRLGFEMIGERAVLSFGPPTGAMPKVTGPMPRVPTGPMPRVW
jgi:GNAT superfamily N-acetyltransferase